MKPLLTSIALATSLLAVPVSAKEKPPVFVEAKPVKDSKTAVTINPAKAYVYVRTSNAMPLHFVRIPSADDQTAYEKLKAAAFVEAREDYEKALKNMSVTSHFPSNHLASRSRKNRSSPPKPISSSSRSGSLPISRLARSIVSKARAVAAISTK